jgi:hypothetical protein
MILGYESFDQTKQMIESLDVENKVVAFEVIEQAEFIENMVYILILLKDSNVSIVDWEKHAPNTTANIRRIYSLNTAGHASPAMSLKGILKKATEYKVAKRQIDFLMVKYAEFLGSYLPSHFTLTITMNERDKSGTTG